ncbi:class I mannose-6-phosphate isomerase [soil metagenome]
MIENSTSSGGKDSMADETGERVSIVEPVLAEMPWGGRRLAEFGLALPDHVRIGEALATSDSVRISAGFASGKTIGEVVVGDPDACLGNRARAVIGGREIFPLLVKLLDANANLSIQVHPGDDQAASQDRVGKTEAWHVLAAEPGAWLYAGLQDDVQVEEFLEAAASLDGSSARLLRRISAQPGTTMLLPAGTVHALGAGVIVYEIQQPSDLTFRLDDWGRVDADGNPREIHQENGAEALRAGLRPDLIVPVELPANEGRRYLLAACQKFALERIGLPGGGRYQVADSEGPHVVTVLSGAGRLGDLSLSAGQSGVVWPGSAPFTLEAAVPTVALRGWVPDLKADLGALLATSGVDPAALAQLSGPLPDVRHAMDL